jgi:hypothetical protein
MFAAKPTKQVVMSRGLKVPMVIPIALQDYSMAFVQRPLPSIIAVVSR